MQPFLERENLKLIEIIKALARAGLTGVLRVSDGTNRGEICFQAGQIIHAVYRDKIGEEAVYESLSWTIKEFSFAADALNVAADDRTVLAPTAAIIARGEDIDSGWRGLKTAIPSPDTVFKPAARDAFQVSLSALEWNVLREINGTSSVLAIAEKLHSTELEVTSALSKLFGIGLVEPVQVSAPKDLGPLAGAEMLRELEAALCRAIGPIAPILLGEQMRAMGESAGSFPRKRLAELGERLSSEVPEGPRRRAFKQTLLELLKK